MHALSLQLLIPYSLNRPEVYSGTDYYRVNTNDLPNLLRTQVCMVLLGVSLLGVGEQATCYVFPLCNAMEIEEEESLLNP